MAIVPYDEVQPRFALYMRAKNLKPGDEFKTYEYMIWISQLAREFNTINKIPAIDPVPPTLQDEFTRFIKSKVENIA